jgi:thioredoxin 2
MASLNTNTDSVVVAACPSCHSLVRIPREKLALKPVCPRCKASVLSGTPVELDAQSFERHALRATLPALVDFWAPWCGPCKMMAPVLDRMAGDWAQRLRVGKVNTDEQGELGARFGIRSIPTLILFQEGREVARQSGAMDPTTLRRWLESVLSD